MPSSHALILGSCFSEETQRELFGDVQMYRMHFQSQAFGPVLRSRVQLGLPLPPPFQR